MLDLTLSGADKEKILTELASQLSAFSNTSGGTIVYGLTDAGEVDQGGVARVIKGNRSCKEWLEDVIPHLTEFSIVGVNVYEVLGAVGKASKIGPGKALIVVSVPESDGAPHQSSRDQRYYIRLGSHSLPASHRLIEDIRNRSKHPLIVVANSTLSHLRIPRFPRGSRSFSGSLELRIRFRIKNNGRIKASNVCLGIEGYNASPSNLRADSEIISHRYAPETAWRFWEFKAPLYPDFEIELVVDCDFAAELTSYVPGVSATWLVGGGRCDVSQAGLSWKIFADSAPPSTGVILFGDLPVKSKAFEATELGQNNEDFRQYFDPHKSLG